jgi:hypothetical protein
MEKKRAKYQKQKAFLVFALQKFGEIPIEDEGK